MSLAEIADNSRTDKNTVHSYLDLYQTLLINKKETAKNVLEVGIQTGGSIKLWSDFFVNADVHGLDIIDMDDVWNELKNKDNIKLYAGIDAYDEDFFKETFLDKDVKFDFMLDDGPHSLESMVKFIILYSQNISNSL